SRQTTTQPRRILSDEELPEQLTVRASTRKALGPHRGSGKSKTPLFGTLLEYSFLRFLREQPIRMERRAKPLPRGEMLCSYPPLLFFGENFLSGSDNGRFRLIQARSGLRSQGEETGNRRRFPNDF